MSVSRLDKVQTREGTQCLKRTLQCFGHLGLCLFEWYVVRCGSKDWHRDDMCSKEIGLCDLSMLFILGSMDKHEFGMRYP